MKPFTCVLLVGMAACSGDRHDPEPPPPADPTLPFPDPVTSSGAIGSGGFGTTGPVMENEPARIAEVDEGTTGSGATGTIVGLTGTASTTGATNSTSTTTATASSTGAAARVPKAR